MRRRRLLGGMTALAVVAAACGGGGGDGESGTATTLGQPTVTQPAGEADPNGVLRFTWGTNAGSQYDPHTATNQFVNIFLYPAYDRLVNLTPEAKLEPMLAESYEFGADQRSLTMRLRKGVTFHDGAPFDATAVKANIERAKTLPRSTLKADLGTVASVDAIDPTTVRFNLSAPSASLPGLLADRAGMMVSPRAFANPDLDLRPVGAGPYRVVDHQPGNVIAYERFDAYWDKSAQKARRVELLMQLNPETRLRALQGGQTDGTSLNPDQIDDARGAGLDVQGAVGTASFLLYLNKTKPELARPEVRQAISAAIDRQGIAQSLHAGECIPSSQPFPEGYWAHNPQVQPPARDLERARSLLRSAGIPDGFSFSAIVVNVPFYVAQAEAIQAQLAEVGIDMSVTQVEPAELLSRFVQQKTADAYFSQWPGATDPAKTVASLLLPTSTFNPGGYADPEIARLAGEGLARLDQGQRASSYQEMAKIVSDSAFHVIVCNPKNISALAPKVVNLRSTIAGSFDVRGAGVAAG